MTQAAHLICINPVRAGHDIIIKGFTEYFFLLHSGHRCFPFNSLTKEVLPVEESSDLLTCSHKGIIRVGNFDSTGTTFVSGGDDKSVKAWDVENWKCLGTRYPSIVFVFTVQTHWQKDQWGSIL